MKLVQVGVGGYGRTWLDTVAAYPRVTYSALVDVAEAVRAAAGARFGVPTFGSVEEALERTDADALLCVVPPSHHEQVITAGLNRGLPVLTEKPLADSMAACHRLVELAERQGKTLMVSQKGSFHPWVERFREEVASRSLSHVTLHYRAPLFRWGFRHTMDDPLLVEMSIHHFDLVRALIGREPLEVSGSSWNTPWSGFTGDTAASLRFTFDGGLPVIYEAYCRSSGDLTSWYGDVRAEGENDVVTMVYPHLYVAERGGSQEHVVAPRRELLRVGDPQDGQAHVLAEFVGAVEQKRCPRSSGKANLTSVAMVFAAVDACRTGTTKKIADYL